MDAKVLGVTATPSLPLRECGLKLSARVVFSISALVTPLAGVWVEMLCEYVGVIQENTVTPLAGVWVEMILSAHTSHAPSRHSPCGSVG